MTAFLGLFQRDLLVALRRPTDAANPLVFFVLAVLLLGVGAGGAERGLGDSAAGAVWGPRPVRQLVWPSKASSAGISKTAAWSNC